MPKATGPVSTHYLLWVAASLCCLQPWPLNDEEECPPLAAPPPTRPRRHPAFASMLLLLLFARSFASMHHAVC